MTDATDTEREQELAALREALRRAHAERDACARRSEELERQLESGAQQQRLAERLLQRFAESAPAVLYIKDLEGRFLLSNSAHTRLLGLTPAEVIGRRERDFLSDEEASAIATISAEVLRARRATQQEFCLTLKDGPHWFLEYIFPLLSESGEPFAIGGVATDVTRRKLAEQQAAMFRSLIEHSPDPMLVVPSPLTREVPLVFANQACAELLGTAAELKAWLAERFVGDDGARLRATLDRGEVWRGTVPYGRGSSERILDVNAFLIADADADASCAMLMRDITEQTRAAAERAELQRRTIAAQDETLRELSTPLLPLSGGVLLLPMLGRFNAARREQLMNALMNGVVRHQVSTVLLDVTGLRELDLALADTLQRVARATRLLGASTVMTGVSPAVARALVTLEITLPGVTTFRTLGDGFEAVVAGSSR